MKHEIIPIMADCRVGTAHQSRLCHSERSEESHPRHCEESAVRRTTCQSLFNLLNSKFSILHSKFLLLLCTCALMLSNIASPAHAKYGGGTGGPNDPYLIFDANQMNEIGLHEEDWDKHFKLMADIDLIGFTGTSFNIIGYYNYPDMKPFTGVFDGSGHTISNFTYTSPDTSSVGLFGYVTGEIKEVGLIDPNVDVGAGFGTNVGSLVGRLRDGTITGCCVEGGSVSGGQFVGGLVGKNSHGSVSNCYSTGDVHGGNAVGGLVGSNYYGTIANCYSEGIVSGSEDVGGLVGRNWEGTISNCYATGSVIGTTNVGGLVGKNSYGTISNCYSIGSVSGNERVGGLVGTNGCYDPDGLHPGRIFNCYSTGSVTGMTNVGGLVGERVSGTVSDSFWDTQTSGQSSSDGGTGKTTSEMQIASTFIGWGCGAVWTIDEGVDYPRLWWENKTGQLITNPSYWEGSGTETDPYLIYTAEQLNTIGLVVCDWDKHFKLMSDIDLSGYTETEFNIIGTLKPRLPFTGVFDGSGHTISNFTYSSTGTRSTGLFGYLKGENAEIKDLGLIEPDVDVMTGLYVGSLVGYISSGTITNCHAEGGSIAGSSPSWPPGSVGGLVGDNYGGTITNCYSTGGVEGEYHVGGLVGLNWEGAITNCYSTGSILGGHRVGGLVGGNQRGTIANCYSTGSVAGHREIGGLMGWNRYGTIKNSYSTGSVTGTTDVGGLVGDNSGHVVSSYWDIETSGQTTSDGGTGKTTTEMQTMSTFTDAGWDFVGERINGREDIWMMTCEGMSYPKLNWWQPVLGDYFCPDGVDMIDMEHLALHWLDTGCDETNDYCDWAEISNDSTIDFTDFAILAGNWLAGL